MINVRKTMDFGAKTLIIVSSISSTLPGIDYANAAHILENIVLAAIDPEVDSIIWSGAAAAVRHVTKEKAKGLFL